MGRNGAMPGRAEEGGPLLPRVQTVARRECGQTRRSSDQGNGGGHGPEGKLRLDGGEGSGTQREREIGERSQIQNLVHNALFLRQKIFSMVN